VWWELGVGLELGGTNLDPRGHDTLGALEAALCDESFDLAWIGLVLDAVLTPAYYPVGGASFLGIVRARA
jgi:hypothetical protein